MPFNVSRKSGVFPAWRTACGNNHTKLSDQASSAYPFRRRRPFSFADRWMDGYVFVTAKPSQMCESYTFLGILFQTDRGLIVQTDGNEHTLIKLYL